MKKHCKIDVSNAIAKFVIKNSMLLKQNFYYSLEAIRTCSKYQVT